MKKINKSAFIFVFLGMIPMIKSQSVKKLTLEEAIALGTKNSKTLIIDEAKIQEATANYLEAKNNR